MSAIRPFAYAALSVALGVACLCSCERKTPPDKAGAPQAAKSSDHSKQTYFWVSQASNLPLFVAHDHKALALAASELGVTAVIAGPQKVDLPAFVAAIDQCAAQKPAGMMVVGWDPSLAAAVDAAIDAGIPVIAVDADLPNSKRISFVGSNWYELGRTQAKFMAEAVGNKGDVAMMGIHSAANMQDGFRGFTDYMKENAPQARIIGTYDDKGSSQEAAKVSADILTANPNLAGLAGFDSQSGPGIAIAVKEAGKAGKVKVTCVDADPEHLQWVKAGVIQAAVGQKREFFTYYGLKMLYDIANSPVSFTGDDKAAGITKIPAKIETGFIVATPENVDLLLRSVPK